MAGLTRLYLAGPLFTQAERLWNVDFAGALRKAGFDVLLPQEQAKTVLNAGGGLSPANVRKLFEIAVQSVEEADAVVAVLDGSDPDSGTCFECGYAFARKRPVVGIRTDIRLGGDDPKQNVNLMLSQGCGRLVVLGGEESFALDIATVADRVIAELGELGIHA